MFIPAWICVIGVIVIALAILAFAVIVSDNHRLERKLDTANTEIGRHENRHREYENKYNQEYRCYQGVMHYENLRLPNNFVMFAVEAPKTPGSTYPTQHVYIKEGSHWCLSRIQQVVPDAVIVPKRTPTAFEALLNNGKKR